MNVKSLDDADDDSPEEFPTVRVAGPIEISIANAPTSRQLFVAWLGALGTIIAAAFAIGGSLLAIGRAHVNTLERAVVAELEGLITTEVSGLRGLITSEANGLKGLIKEGAGQDERFHNALDYLGKKLLENGTITEGDLQFFAGLMATVSYSAIEDFGNAQASLQNVDLHELRKDEKIVSVMSSQSITWGEGGYFAVVQATDPKFDTATVDFYSDKDECHTSTYKFSENLNFKFCCLHAHEDEGMWLEIIAVLNAAAT